MLSILKKCLYTGPVLLERHVVTLTPSHVILSVVESEVPFSEIRIDMRKLGSL